MEGWSLGVRTVGPQCSCEVGLLEVEARNLNNRRTKYGGRAVAEITGTRRCLFFEFQRRGRLDKELAPNRETCAVERETEQSGPGSRVCWTIENNGPVA